MPTINEQRQQHLNQQRQYEQYWRNRLFIALRKQKLPVIRMAKEQGLLSAYVRVEQLIQPEPLQRVLLRMYKDIVPTVGDAAYTQYLEGVKSTIPGGWAAAIDAWLRTFLFDMIRNMTAYTKTIILDIISKGLQNGDDYESIISQIEATGIDRIRASAIARTESNRAMAWAKYESIARLPYAADVMWIAARDRRTRGVDGKDRNDHYHMNGDIVPYGTPFTDPRSGAKLLYPGDLSNGALGGDTVNCRCTISARRRK